jgi:serine/threonine-protein kinase RsbW
MAAGTSVKLVISSEIRLIDLVHAASEKMAELAGFAEDEALNVGLAVREAAINAVLHGNRQDPSRKVSVTLEGDEQGLRATVRDEGEGFDPKTAADPTEGANRLRTSGRGLLLMQAFVDEVRFRRSRGGGTEVTMTKRRPTAGDRTGTIE